jgi:hypothetical protein
MLSNTLSSTDFFRKINIKKSNRTVQDDLNYGYANESQILNKLNSTFSDIFRNTKELHGKYCNYDFEGSSTGKKIEMKSRRNKYNDFDKTIIPVHKCKNINSPDIFVFQFIDGIYYIEYDEDKFNTFEIKNIISNRKDKCENKPHYFISIADLIKM